MERGRFNNRGRGRGRGSGGCGGSEDGPHSGIEGSMAEMSLAESYLDPRSRGAKRGSGEEAIESQRARFDLVATRPESCVSKEGTSGIQVGLTTNLIGFSKRPDYRILQYRVDFENEEDTVYVKKRLLYQHGPPDGHALPKFILDGSTLFTCQPLFGHHQEDKKLVLTSTLRRKNGDERTVQITIRFAKEVQPTDPEYIQFYNILQRKNMEKLDMHLIGRNFYDKGAAKTFREFDIEIWPGYKTSIRQHEQDVLMTADVINKFIRLDTVLNQLKNLHSRFGRNFYIEAKRKLVGSIIMTRYNNKTYRIDDINFDLNPQGTFPWHGEEKRYIDYYKETWGIEIKDTNQPLLVSQPKDKDRRGGTDGPIVLIPELCFMTGQSDEIRENYKLQSAIQEITKHDPLQRVKSLTAFIKRLRTNEAVVKESEAWGLNLKPDLVQLKGRVLNPEAITLRAVYQSKEADWTRKLMEGIYTDWTISKWAVLYPRPMAKETEAFIKAMFTASSKMNIKIIDPKKVIIEDSKIGTYMRELDEICAQVPHMIMVVLPNQKSDAYGAVKKKLINEKPVPSQVITRRVMKAEHKMLSFATKVVVQMAAKLGAEPWSVRVPSKDLMVVGFDTYHDTVRKNCSVGALTASLNQNLTKYFSTHSTHHDGTEISNQIPLMLVAAMKKYFEENRKYPKKIIFYRDGVGEGQIEYVNNIELQNVKAAFKKIGIEPPRLTYVIVSKRINAKFFLNMGNNGYGNPHSGTVIDNTVTLPERYDFFLISQSVRFGTVNPTSYNVILDEVLLKPDHLQQLSYKLTHLYYNWPGTIRVPAPCQYAHKLAKLIGEHLHSDVIPEPFADLLFYL